MKQGNNPILKKQTKQNKTKKKQPQKTTNKNK